MSCLRAVSMPKTIWAPVGHCLTKWPSHCGSICLQHNAVLNADVNGRQNSIKTRGKQARHSGATAVLSEAVQFVRARRKSAYVAVRTFRTLSPERHTRLSRRGHKGPQ